MESHLNSWGSKALNIEWDLINLIFQILPTEMTQDPTIMYKNLTQFTDWDSPAAQKKPNTCCNYKILEIKPCGLGSRIRDMEAESYN